MIPTLVIQPITPVAKEQIGFGTEVVSPHYRYEPILIAISEITSPLDPSLAQAPLI